MMRQRIVENFFLQISEHQLDTPVGNNKPILYLKNLTREDSGMYSCMATNGAGYPARDTIMLIVQCEFYIHDPACDLYFNC